MSLSGSIERLRQFHPGDPEMEALYEWRRSEEGRRIAEQFLQARPKDDPKYRGQVMVFGTGGDLENYAVGFDPYFYGPKEVTEEDTPAASIVWHTKPAGGEIVAYYPYRPTTPL